MKRVQQNVIPSIMDRTVRKHASVPMAVRVTMSQVLVIANQDSLVLYVKRGVLKEPMVMNAKTNVPARMEALVILLQGNVTVLVAGLGMFVVIDVQQTCGATTVSGPVSVSTEQLATTLVVSASVCQDSKEKSA